MDQVRETIVIDNGSGVHKAGWAGDYLPRIWFQTVIGNPLYNRTIIDPIKRDLYIGDDALRKSGILSIKSPIENGIITNLDDLVKIWDYIFINELRVKPNEHPILLTEPPKNPKVNREKMSQVMFETYNVPSLYIGIQGILSIYTSGRTAGIVCECGDGVTQIIPIYEGYYFKHATIRQNLGGHDITNYLQKLLNDQGCYFSTSSEKEIVRNIKEKHSYVALNYDDEISQVAPKPIEKNKYILPDGHSINLNDEMFKCTELLFNPFMNGFEFKGIHKALVESIKTCDIDVRKDLYANIILSGGSSKIKGIPERIEKEITNLAPPKVPKIKVLALPEGEFGVWAGGSIIASLTSFPQISVSNDEYKENGLQIIHNKFL